MHHSHSHLAEQCQPSVCYRFYTLANCDTPCIQLVSRPVFQTWLKPAQLLHVLDQNALTRGLYMRPGFRLRIYGKHSVLEKKSKTNKFPFISLNEQQTNNSQQHQMQNQRICLALMTHSVRTETNVNWSGNTIRTE